MNTNLLLTILIGAMVLVSVLQAIQLFSLQSTLVSGVSVGGSKSVSSSPAGNSGSAQLPSNLENLPSMVGGC
ncbi:MAG: hypothetical protein J4428_01825 [Candidatus Aenigmarchaeota archaeon]|nr:hypothetical protein [Candidatus Aenigmarchaeota archaeon]